MRCQRIEHIGHTESRMCIHWVCTESAPSLRRVCAESAPSLRRVCAESPSLRRVAPSLRRVCAESAPSLRRVCAESASSLRRVYTESTLSLHRVYTTSTLSQFYCQGIVYFFFYIVFPNFILFCCTTQYHDYNYISLAAFNEINLRSNLSN